MSNISLKDKILDQLFNYKSEENYFYDFTNDKIITVNKRRFNKFLKKYAITDGTNLSEEEWDFVYIIENQNVFELPDNSDYRIIRNDFLRSLEYPGTCNISQEEFNQFIKSNKGYLSKWKDFYFGNKYRDVILWICEHNLGFYECSDDMYTALFNYAMSIYKNKPWKRFLSSDIIHGTYGNRHFYYCVMGNVVTTKGIMIYEGEDGLNMLQHMLKSIDNNVDKTLILTHQNNYCVYYEEADKAQKEDVDFYDSFDVENNDPKTIAKLLRYTPSRSRINRLSISDAKTMFVALIILDNFFKDYSTHKKIHNSNKNRFIYFDADYSCVYLIAHNKNNLFSNPSKPLWSSRGFPTIKPKTKIINTEYEFQILGLPLISEGDQKEMPARYMCILLDHLSGKDVQVYFTDMDNFLEPMEEVANAFVDFFNEHGVAKKIYVDNQSDYLLLTTILSDSINVECVESLPEITTELEFLADKDGNAHEA